MYAVVVHEELEPWLVGLPDEDWERVSAAVSTLENLGPAARRPLVGTLTGSRLRNLRELRTGAIRILFVFDPDRDAILLVGADKSTQGWSRWYTRAIPEAEARYESYLKDREQDR
jgi:hypothetical protein